MPNEQCQKIQYAIRGADGTIREHTVSTSEDGAWEKFLGFVPVDDQWAYRRQRAEEKGCRSVIVEVIIKEVCRTQHSIMLDEYYKIYPPGQ